MKIYSIHGETLGQRIKNARKDRKMSQTELGNLVGVTDRWISQVEQDKAVPSPELIHKFAQSFQVPVRELLQDDKMEIVSMIKLVEVLLETNRPTDAEFFLNKLEIAELSEYEKINMSVLRSEFRFQTQKYQGALDLLLPLIGHLESVNYHDAHLLAKIRNKIGKIYYKIQEYKNAYYNFRKAYDYTSRFPEVNSLVANISYNMGILSRKLGMHTEATYYLEAANEFYKKNNDLKKLADTIFDQAISCLELRDFARASALLDQAKAIFVALNEEKWSYKVQLVISSYIVSKDDPETALTQLQECASKFQEQQDHAALVYCYSMISKVYLGMEVFDLTMSYLKKTEQLIIDHDLASIPETGEFYKIFATYHHAVQNYPASIHYALQSADIFGTIRLLQDQYDSLGVAVNSCQSLSDFKQAFLIERTRNQLLEQIMQRKELRK